MYKHLSILILLCSAAQAGADDPLAERVEASIARAIKYVFSKQCSDGHWECDATTGTHSKSMQCGQTAQTVYALLESDVSPSDSRLKKGLDWLIANPEPRTYTLGFGACAFELAARKSGDKDRKKYRDALRKYVVALYRSVTPIGHRYVLQEKMGSLSNDHIGALGVWAGQRSRLEVPSAYWRLARKHWTRLQNDDGGWPYVRGKDSRSSYGDNKKTGCISLTAGGLATLYVCNDILNAAQFATCRGNKMSPAIRNGLDWMEKNFPRAVKSGHGERMISYTFYAVERAALACGYRSFGNVDWYRGGCEFFLQRQKPDGRFETGPSGKFRGSTYVAPTCFALLFLVRGRQPVAFSKLEYSGDWNNRPRAIAYLTRWMGREFERTYNWQIVQVQSDVDQWHDAPILVISGSKKPEFSDADLKKLCTFVHQGGTILSVTECNGRAFGDGILEAYGKMFPQYRIMDIGPDHPLRKKDVLFEIKDKVSLKMITNGVRPLIFHADHDLTRTWQLKQSVTRSREFQVAVNMLRYAAGTIASLPRRSSVIWPKPLKKKPGRRVKVARLRHGGNYDPEPLAWERFSRIMGRKYGVGISVAGPIDITTLPSAGVKIASITGTGPLKLSAGETGALASFVKGGGLLIVDAAGGDKDFAQTAAAHLDKLIEGKKLEGMSATDKLFSMKGLEIKKIRYRRKTMDRMPGTAIRLMEIDTGGKGGVIFSREDITSGLVGYGSYIIDGYRPRTAFELMRNIVLSAAGQDKAHAKARKYEAEDARLRSCNVENKHGGFSGKGFANPDKKSGAAIEWTVEVPAAGTYGILVQYAIHTADRPLKASVNGEVVIKSLSFPSTGDLKKWKSVEFDAELRRGQNKIRLETIGKEGPNLDFITVKAR